MRCVVQNAVWITWEKQQRNRSMARQLGADLHELVYDRDARLVRYIKCTIATYKVIRRKVPAVVYFQNPSVLLGLWLALLAALGPLRKAHLVGDFHNAGIHAPRWLSVLNRFIARRCTIVIVSNDNLGKVVRSWGGRPFAMPDPLPDFEGPMTSCLESEAPFRVLFICSWAADEPVEEVLKGATLLKDEHLAIQITGRPKRDRLVEPLPANVHLTGYLSDVDFHSALFGAHAVMDLTTRDDCMVCGGYEGLAAGKPLILSSNEPTREWFGKAAVYCDNSASTIAAAMREVRRQYADKRTAVVKAQWRVGQETEKKVCEIKGLLGVA